MVTASGARGEVSMLCPLSSYLREVSHHSHPVTPPSRFKRQLTSVVCGLKPGHIYPCRLWTLSLKAGGRDEEGGGAEGRL